MCHVASQGVQGFFCHVMVENLGQEVAKACRARVIGIQVETPRDRFVPHPDFRNPFVLKWAHEEDFCPKDIEHDIPCRLDLCVVLANQPDSLRFMTSHKPDGNRKVYGPGTYKVRIRVNAANAKPTDGDFIVHFNGDWQHVRVTSATFDLPGKPSASTIRTSPEDTGKRPRLKLRIWAIASSCLVLLTAFSTLLLNLDRIKEKLAATPPPGDSNQLPSSKTIKDSAANTTLNTEGNTSGEGSPVITVQGTNNSVVLNSNLPDAQAAPTPAEGPLNGSTLHLTLAGICADIESRPLAQQQSTADQYCRLPIKRERLEVSQIYAREDDPIFDICLIFPNESSAVRRRWTITCRVPRDEYPQLYAAKDGTVFYVTGQIESIGVGPMGPLLSLADPTLEFE